MSELEKIYGIGTIRASQLQNRGLKSIEDVATAGLSELTTLDGVGQSRAKKIQYSARRLVADNQHSDDRVEDSPEEQPDQQHTGIQYDLVVTSNQEYFGRFAQDGVKPPVASLATIFSDSREYSISQIDDRMLVTVNGDDHQFGFSIAEDLDEDYYIDWGCNGYFPIPNSELPKTETQANIHVDIDATNEIDHIRGREARKFTLSASVGRFRPSIKQELWLVTDEELAGYEKLALQKVLPGPLAENEDLIERLAENGFPVSGRTFNQDKEIQVSKFDVENISVRKFSLSTFSPPAKFTDVKNEWIDRVERPAEREVVTPTSDFDHLLSETRVDVQSRETQIGRVETHPGLHPVMGTDNTLRADRITESVATFEGPTTCLPGNYENSLSINVRQPLLDTTKDLANLVARRLHEFEGENGSIVLDWMRQFRDHAETNPDTDGIYCLFHNASEPAASSEESQLGGRGLMDSLAKREAKRVLAGIPSQPFQNPFTPTSLSDLLLNVFDIQPGTAAAIEDIVTNSTVPPEGRYDALPAGMRGEFRDAILLLPEPSSVLSVNSPGLFEWEYPATSEWVTYTHEFDIPLVNETLEIDLLQARLDDIGFRIQLDEEDDDNEFEHPDIFTGLTIGDDGEIELELYVPKMMFDSGVDMRIPVGVDFQQEISGDPCFFIPSVECAFTFELEIVIEWFITLPGFEFETSISELELDAIVQAVEESNRVGLAVTETGLEFDDVEVTYSLPIFSALPELSGFEEATGQTVEEFANEILNEIVDDLVDEAEILTNQVNDLLPDILSDSLSDSDLTLPPAFIEGDAGVDRSEIDSREEQDLYLETAIGMDDSPGITGIHTRVNSNLQSFQYFDAANFQADILDGGQEVGDGRHFLSMGISQNYLNTHLARLWMEEAFRFEFGLQARQQIGDVFFQLIENNPPDLTPDLPRDDSIFGGSNGETGTSNTLSGLSVTATTPPRTQLVGNINDHGYAAVTSFDDLRACFNWTPRSNRDRLPESRRVVEVLFNATVWTRPGFRQSTDPTSQREPVFDLFFELDAPRVELGDSAIHDVNTDYGQPSIAEFDDEWRAAWNEMLRELLRRGLRGESETPGIDRSTAVIPHDPDDSPGILRYGGDNNDSDGFEVVVQFTPQRGILYGHLGVQGLLVQLFENGAFDDLTCGMIEPFYDSIPSL